MALLYLVSNWVWAAAPSRNAALSATTRIHSVRGDGIAGENYRTFLIKTRGIFLVNPPVFIRLFAVSARW